MAASQSNIHRSSIGLSHSLTRIFCVLLLLYPLCHVIAAKAVHMNPWRLGGWGMYAVPEPNWSAQVDGSVSDDPALVAALQAWERCLNTYGTICTGKRARNAVHGASAAGAPVALLAHTASLCTDGSGGGVELVYTRREGQAGWTRTRNNSCTGGAKTRPRD